MWKSKSSKRQHQRELASGTHIAFTKKVTKDGSKSLDNCKLNMKNSPNEKKPSYPEILRKVKGHLAVSGLGDKRLKNQENS